MITEQAIVTARRGERIEVRLLRESACGQCEMQSHCGMAAIGRLLGRRDRPLTMKTDRSLAPGDRLQLGISENALVRGSLTVYGYPLAGLLAGASLASVAGLAEWLVVLLACGGFALGIGTARARARELEEFDLTPHIVHIQVNPVTRSRS